MTKKLLLAFAIVGLAVASAKTYTVTLYQDSKIGSMDLKAGTYSIEVKENKAIIRNGKVQGEADVRVETVDRRFPSTTVRMAQGDGDSMKVEEIRLGGTKEKLVFSR
jgi:hypothetical protein